MKLDHPSDVCFKHSAISFGVPDMPPPDVGRSMGPISLHNAIGLRSQHAPASGFRLSARSLRSLSALQPALNLLTLLKARALQARSVLKGAWRSLSEASAPR